MRSLLLAPLAALLFSGVLLAGAPRTIDFVLDLDDTLIRWVRPDEAIGGSTILPKTGTIEGYRYRVLDGAPELIQSILRIPGARVSVFSAGEPARNTQILDQFKLPNGKTLRESAYRVFSRTDLSILGNQDQPERRAKDLRKLFASDRVDLSNVILIDDHPDFVFPGQQKNLLWVGQKPRKFQIKKGEGPLTDEEFFQDRNKLARVRGLIARMTDEARKKGGPVSEELWRNQYITPSGGIPHYNEELLRDLSLYRRGAELLRLENPGFHLISDVGGLGFYGCLRETLHFWH